MVWFAYFERSERCFFQVMSSDVLRAAAASPPGTIRVTARGLTPLPARKRVS
jgi:hypothetical protein